MGQVLWIVDAEAAPDTLAEDLWALSRFNDELDRMCKKLSVKKLSEFHDNSGAAAEFGVDMEPVISEPAELLTTLATLSATVGGGKGTFQVSGEDRRADVESELQNAIRVTRECQYGNRKVRVTGGRMTRRKLFRLRRKSWGRYIL